jgi:hypothetical protein
MLANVPGIGFVLIGEGDLSQELGLARQYEHPEVLAAMGADRRHLPQAQGQGRQPAHHRQELRTPAERRLQLPDVGAAAQLRRDRQGARNGGVLR